jgi:hypothetical protein
LSSFIRHRLRIPSFKQIEGTKLYIIVLAKTDTGTKLEAKVCIQQKRVDGLGKKSLQNQNLLYIPMQQKKYFKMSPYAR